MNTHIVPKAASGRIQNGERSVLCPAPVDRSSTMRAGVTTEGTQSENTQSDTYIGLRQGNAAVQSAVWNEQFPLLVRAAKRMLDGFPRRSFDEEDVALAALQSFFEGIQAGAIYPWQSAAERRRLLLTITRRKAFAFRRREMRAKRGGGKVRGDSLLYKSPQGESSAVRRHEPKDEGPSPKTQCIRAEDQRRLLEMLPNKSLHQVARLRLEGHTNQEIARIVGCARRTVERKVHIIRAVWRRRSTAG